MLSGASYAQAFQVNARRSCTGPAGTDEAFVTTTPGFPRNEENRSNFESQVTLADAATTLPCRSALLRVLHGGVH